MAFATSMKLLKRIHLSKSVSRHSSFDFAGAKKFNDLPKMSIMENISILSDSKNKVMHLAYEKHAKKYGPLFRIMWSTKQGVLCSSASAVEAMFRHEEKYPMRISLAPVHLVQPDIEAESGLPYDLGVILADGKDWQKQRSAIQKSFLRPRQLSLYTDGLDKIAASFSKELGNRREQGTNSYSGFLLNDILARWSFEGACLILTNRDFQSSELFDKDLFSRMVAVLDDQFTVIEQLFFIPPTLAKSFNLKVWRRYKANTSEFVKTFKPMTEMCLSETESDGDSSLIKQLYEDGLSKGEIVGSLLDILSASMDTTARTAGFLLYYLGKYPDLQQQIREELSNVNNKSNPLFAGFLKETLRLLPVGPLMTRRFREDIVLDGYRIPKESPIIISLWNIGRDERNFPDPERFDVTRWDKQYSKKEYDPFAHTPFGWGKRSCLGRRLAEMELLLLMRHVLTNYRVELTKDEEIDHKLRFVLTNASPIPVKLIDL